MSAQLLLSADATNETTAADEIADFSGPEVVVYSKGGKTDMSAIPVKDVVIVIFMLGLWLYSILLIVRAWAKVHVLPDSATNIGGNMWKFVMEYIHKKRKGSSAQDISKSQSGHRSSLSSQKSKKGDEEEGCLQAEFGESGARSGEVTAPQVAVVEIDVSKAEEDAHSSRQSNSPTDNHVTVLHHKNKFNGPGTPCENAVSPRSQNRPANGEAISSYSSAQPSQKKEISSEKVDLMLKDLSKTDQGSLGDVEQFQISPEIVERLTSQSIFLRQNSSSQPVDRPISCPNGSQQAGHPIMRGYQTYETMM